MTFDVLEKSPEVAPLLVRLYDTHNLYALAEDKGNEDACFELTSIMVDLLNIRLSDKESELITDVLLALMKQAEKDLKIALADRLSGMDNVPLRMVLGLANEDIAIAAPVLRNSPVLHDLDLIYILQSKGISHGRSIALRNGLSATIINMLADTKDFQIAVNLSGNDGATLTDHAYRIFGDMAKYSEVLARPLLSREDVPQEVAGKLYQFVGEELKQLLTERFGIGASKIVAAAIDDITMEIRETDAAKHGAGEMLLAHAHNQHRRGELKLASVIATLRRGQYSTFLAQFSVLCGLSVDMTKAMIRQETGKGLALTCRALDIQKADFVSLFLLTERFRAAGKRTVNHKELTRIMTMYDAINRDEAISALNNSRN
jgi:uncharacterized protein (DUF2336 family)